MDMKFNTKVGLLVAIFIVAFGRLSAQKAESQVLDGVYEKMVTAEKEIIPYEHIREADVSWLHRIWRVIDVREKQNLAFKYRRLPLIEIIHEAVKAGELTVYDPTVDFADEFMQVLPIEEAASIGESVDTQMVVDPETFEESYEIVTNTLSYVDIKKFRLKEDWFFDKETSTMMCRIIGFAPIMEDFDEDGNYRGDVVMYWVYYPDLRPLLVKHETFNPFNLAVRMSWEDVFEMRMFASWIIKESNIYDRRIVEYMPGGMDAIFESDKIKKKIFDIEHELWSY